MQKTVTYSITLLLVLFALPTNGQPVTKQVSHIELAWESPRPVITGEDRFVDGLSFPESIYSDSLPGVPAYQYRIAEDIPHFSYKLELVGEVYEPVSEQELSVLVEAGYIHSAPSITTVELWERKSRITVATIYPFRYHAHDGSYEKLVSFTLEKSLVYDENIRKDGIQVYNENSVFASGNWYKVCVDQTGIHRLEYSDLVSMGVPLQGLQRNRISIFGHAGGMLPEANSIARPTDPVEQAIFVSGAADGVFSQSDYILFFGMSPNKWTLDPQTGYFNHKTHLYATESCYFLTTDSGAGKRITAQEQTSAGVTHQVSNFIDFAHHEQDLLNLIGSGQVWYGEMFEGTLTRDIDFSMADIDVTSPARVRVSLAARSAVPSAFTVSAGDAQTTVPMFTVVLDDYNNFFARDNISNLIFRPSQTNSVRVRVVYNRPANTSRGWLDYISLNVRRNLRFSGSQMGFRNTDVIGAGNVAEYTLANTNAQIAIWDVTDPYNIRRQDVSQSGSNLVFRVHNDILREFVAFNGTTFLKPRLAGSVGNQNLHGIGFQDMIIVCPPELITEAQRLADYRTRQDGLRISIVTPAQIYNEFSSGSPDASAIRNFMKMLYDRATNVSEIPRYLLLFGNGTIDNKDNLGFGGNLIPTYQSEASLSPSNSFMTDDYFGLLADNEGEAANGLLDIGIGRLPVRTLDEAKLVVDKIIRYDKRDPNLDPMQDNQLGGNRISNYADWRNMVVFIADDGDFNTHFSHAERLSEIVRNGHPYYNLEKIYLDAYPMTTMAGGSRYPDVNRTINNRVNKGALLINYIGHGGVKGLAHERVVTFEDIATWDNHYNMPVLMTATCEFSSFDQPDPDELSAGVRILLKPDGGAVALYTTTRLAWAGTNLTLNENFMKNVFRRDASGQLPRLGDLIRVAKVQSHGMVQPWRLKNFVLLGDPSMQMAYPEYQVITTEIPDTIKAFQQATVSGYIADQFGNRLTGYNGIIYPTVYDKYTSFETLANASGSNKANFDMRNSMLYKGKASVVDGDFSFTFVIPKDIAYRFDTGKISYYADNGMQDAHGNFNNFIIGGTLDSYAPDAEGPEISLFMNDTSFVSGGKTNENPVLLAYVRDESGINIAGRIGHDMVAYLNDEFSQPIVLNNYFEADVDSYKSGRVAYPFSRLADGQYTLSVRVWDIHNNPSTAHIEFVVVSSSNLVLEALYNFPNPLGQEGTNFVFSHNLPLTDLQVKIDIYDLSGRQLTSINRTMQSGGFQSPAIHWDGTTSGGHMIGDGLYIYRLQLTTPDGKNAYQSEKLLIIRE